MACRTFASYLNSNFAICTCFPAVYTTPCKARPFPDFSMAGPMLLLPYLQTTEWLWCWWVDWGECIFHRESIVKSFLHVWAHRSQSYLPQCHGTNRDSSWEHLQRCSSDDDRNHLEKDRQIGMEALETFCAIPTWTAEHNFVKFAETFWSVEQEIQVNVKWAKTSAILGHILFHTASWRISILKKELGLLQLFSSKRNDSVELVLQIFTCDPNLSIESVVLVKVVPRLLFALQKYSPASDSVTFGMLNLTPYT